MRGRHAFKLDRVRRVESWRCSRQDRRSERVNSGKTGRRTDVKAVSHARQQPVELFVAQFDLARKDLTDTRLPDAANRDSSDWVVPVSSITSRKMSFRLDMEL